MNEDAVLSAGSAQLPGQSGVGLMGTRSRFKKNSEMSNSSTSLDDDGEDYRMPQDDSMDTTAEAAEGGDEVELTKEQEAEFKKAFTLYDKDKDNKLSSAEIGPALRSCALTPTEAELNAIISNIDNQGGFADFPEFLSYAARLLPEKDPEELLREAFTRWDTNNCGFLNATSLREAMVTMGEPLTEEEADEMIKEALPTGDGQINYEDLLLKLIKEYR